MLILWLLYVLGGCEFLCVRCVICDVCGMMNYVEL